MRIPLPRQRLFNMLFTSLRGYDDFGSAIESNPICLERALIYCEGPEIRPGDIDLRDFIPGRSPWTGSAAAPARPYRKPRTRAAEEPGITRKALLNKMTLPALKLPRRKAGSWVFDPALNKKLRLVKAGKPLPGIVFFCAQGLNFRLFDHYRPTGP
ncbi:MAG: hypothetical protein LBP42_01710 [Treponema sp.]|nr:hypothetical protein [Treponema sp.]